MIRLMELTMNQANMNLGNANAEWGSTGWRMPEFGVQKYVAEVVKSIFHIVRHFYLCCRCEHDGSSRPCRPRGLHHSRRRLGVEMDKKPFETSIKFLLVAGKNVTLQS